MLILRRRPDGAAEAATTQITRRAYILQYLKNRNSLQTIVD
jgi:hypothetical protein